MCKDMSVPSQCLEFRGGLGQVHGLVYIENNIW